MVTGTISFTLTDSLPEPPEKGVLEQGKYYAEGMEDATWFYDYNDRAPYAFSDRSRSPEEVRISVLSSRADILRSSNVLMLLIETEDLLRRRGGLMLHGCLLHTPQGGLIFTGPSGIGKSTQGSLWETYGEGWVLNGDRAGLCLDEDGWSGWGLPFAGSSCIYLNAGTRLRGIVVLEQGKENLITPLRGTAALSRLYPQTHLHRWSRSFMEQGTESLLSLLGSVPVYLLTCRPDRGAVDLVRETVFGG